VRHLVARFVRDRSAATAIEYGLLATLISIAIIAGATVAGSQIGSMLQGVAGKIITPN
jgi:pilus assembly protein Flp/PilA